MNRTRRADLMLLAVTVCWGVSFPAIKAASPHISATLFVALRFVAATALMAAAWPLFIRTLPVDLAVRGRRLLTEPLTARHGLELGVLAALGYTTQTVGMHHTSANNSAFITALSVVLVPVFLFVIRRERPGLPVMGAVALAVAGLALMTRPDLGGLNTGDVWTLGTAVSYAVYLIRLNAALKVANWLPLVVWTMAVCAVLNAGAALLIETPRLEIRSEVLWALAVTTLMSTILALTLQNRFQGDTTPTRAALIFSAEPVTASFFSWLLLGETLGRHSLAGAGLILAAVLVTELTGAGEEQHPEGADDPDPERVP